MEKRAITWCQILTAQLICRLSFLYGGYRLYPPTPHFSSTARYIFVANHQSRIDSFIILGALRFHDQQTIAPVKFLTATSLYYSVLRGILFSWGCYPVRSLRNPHRSAVDRSISLLGSGYNIMMFPEGRRSLAKESNPHSGICRILEGAPTTQLVLAHIEWRRSGFMQLRRHASIRISPAPDSLNIRDPSAIMAAIYKL